MSAVLTSLTDHRANFKELAATIASSCNPDEMRAYIDGLKAVDTTDEGYFGRYTEAASIMRDARVASATLRYAELRAFWRKNLDEFVNATTITEENIHPSNGASLQRQLTALEAADAEGFKDGVFGDLLPEVLTRLKEALVAHKSALKRIAMMVVDPDDVPDDTDASLEALEHTLAMSKLMPLSLDVFFGDEELLATMKERHTKWVAKQEALVAKVREREKAAVLKQVESAVADRDEAEHRNRVTDAGLTPEERAKRAQRAVEAADHMYRLLRRLTEITKVTEPTEESPGFGVLDATGLMEVVQQAQVMTMRVEGRLQ